MMPVGEGAQARVCREVAPEPLLLRRAGIHGDVAVQDDDVPGAQLEAVIALRGVARRRAEIAVIARRAARVVIVVAGRRLGAGLVAAPGCRASLAVARGPALSRH